MWGKHKTRKRLLLRFGGHDNEADERDYLRNVVQNLPCSKVSRMARHVTKLLLRSVAKVWFGVLG